MKTVFTDERTGRTVWRMTNDNSVSFAPYMYRQAFTPDERFIVYSSEKTGKREVWRAELETGETECLTNTENYTTKGMSMTLTPDGTEALFLDGTTVTAVHVLTKESRVIADIAELSGGVPPSSFMPSPDGKQLLIAYPRRSDKRQAVALAPSEGQGTPEEVYVWDDTITGITHLLFSPAEPLVVTYNRHPDKQNDFSCSPAERARCWKLNLATGEDAPFLTVPVGYRATHEYWAWDGSRLYFHQKTQPGWIPAMISSVPKEGGEITIHYQNDTEKLGHSSVNRAHTHLVSDSQEPGINPLLLIDLATGQAETLCYPNASGAPHPNHVHPAFSPSGRYIIYTSDVTGTAQVYIVPLQ
jgi:oligogalacturonide lyase